MAKNTLALLGFLTLVALFLISINIRNTIYPQKTAPVQIAIKPLISSIPTSQPTSVPRTSSPAISIIPPSSSGTVSGTSVYDDPACKLHLTYPATYVRQSTSKPNSSLFIDTATPPHLIALACAAAIPRPPVTADHIESVLVDSRSALLYHDTADDGSPRDEVIIRNPAGTMDIIIASTPETLKFIIPSVKFIL